MLRLQPVLLLLLLYIFGLIIIFIVVMFFIIWCFILLLVLEVNKVSICCINYLWLAYTLFWINACLFVLFQLYWYSFFFITSLLIKFFNVNIWTLFKPVLYWSLSIGSLTIVFPLHTLLLFYLPRFLLKILINSFTWCLVVLSGHWVDGLFFILLCIFPFKHVILSTLPTNSIVSTIHTLNINLFSKLSSSHTTLLIKILNGAFSA